MPKYGPQIDAVRPGDRIDAVPVVVAEASGAQTKDGKPYTRYVFRDRTGTLNGIRWDHAVEAGEVMSVALLTGDVSEYRGARQVKVGDLLVLDSPGDEVLSRLQTSISSQQRDELVEILRGLERTLPPVFWRLFCLSVGHAPYDLEGSFWTYAAAQNHHHTERGGLAWHVLTMAALVDGFASWYPKLDVALLKLAVLTHDLGKIDCYEMGAVGARVLPLDRTVGHTTYSMQRVYNAISQLRAEGCEFTAADEENLLHCIAGHHGRLEWAAVREPVTPEAKALHALDYLDSQLRGGLTERSEDPPDRGGLAPVTVAAPAEAPATSDGVDDPFLSDEGPDPFADEVDDRDPFADDDTPPLQPTLF